MSKIKNIHATAKPSAPIKPYLKPLFHPIRKKVQQPLTEADLAEFKKFVTTRPDDAYKRAKRRDIKKYFSKSVAALTLAEWQDYQKPNFHAPEYLKELWPQLTAGEQELVKQTNGFAFTFPASFERQEDFRRACADRLERFFGRKFIVKRSGRKV